MEAPEEVQIPGLADHEDPDTRYASDARHWIAIYREHVGLCRDLLERAREVHAKSVRAVDAAPRARDVSVLEARLRRIRRG